MSKQKKISWDLNNHARQNKKKGLKLKAVWQRIARHRKSRRSRGYSSVGEMASGWETTLGEKVLPICRGLIYKRDWNRRCVFFRKLSQLRFWMDAQQKMRSDTNEEALKHFLFEFRVVFFSLDSILFLRFAMKSRFQRRLQAMQCRA